ncbi:50S ribosomal protein L25/general stress protein Ctc [Polycladomyces sp. WAk]|uniref:Large ribosomal subunit protein bL25 n=1 Tax=Polycladomyces zharkentensis TaxID=2807616 RepID=A0ABS2WMB6_9BACL|nr:50S ribosomal protein L25/general stress protein Ctc [Polycladomyces sp. WAk]MBN2910669.1 50S ribosomal protein L25/general stress protein Ctc [Polycladomyces sp. WAk]
MALTIQAQRREARPKALKTKLRKQGRVPGVFYGKEIEPQLLHVDEVQLARCLQQGAATSVIQLELDDQTYPVIIREWQRDELRDKLLHVDFYAVEMDEPIDTEVPLVLEGEPKGVKVGGVLQQQLREVEIRALPDRIPEVLTLDVSELEIGDTVTLQAVKLPDGVKLLSDPDEVVAAVTRPQVAGTDEGESEAESAVETATVNS